MFFWCCTLRSVQQARRHPRAALEVTILHLALLPLERRSVYRLAASWGLAITHLGLLGREAQSIGPAKGYADPLADAVFWMWHAWQREPSSVLRAAVTAMWLLVARAVVGVPRKPVLPSAQSREFAQLRRHAIR